MKAIRFWVVLPVVLGLPVWGQGVEDMTGKFSVAPGFKLERVYEVPKGQGSWVSMTRRDDGRIVVGDQYGKLYNVTVPGLDGGTAVVETVPVDIGGAHGLLWFGSALYVTVNEGVGGDSGVHLVTDENGDGKLDTAKLLKGVHGRGEHGPHALVPSPDGKWIYYLGGNHTKLPEGIDRYLVPRHWGEDHLLPRQPDPRGHARSTMAPGGHVCRFRPDGSGWELVSSGYRNAYDMAFNDQGDLFVYDGDMEWDFGLPWYRPTRVCHAVPGSEFGWRNGTGKWPDYYEDSLPAVLDIGPGSPTGVVPGRGAKFPARFQRAVFLLDWTFATLYALHLEFDGASYTGTTEEIVAGSGLPLTDAVIGKDGALYFATGGRRTTSALWRVVYVGDESTAPAKRARSPEENMDSQGPRFDLAILGSMMENIGEIKVDGMWDELGSGDRTIRYSARVVLEGLPLETWRDRLAAERDPWTVISASIALARVGVRADRKLLLACLGNLRWPNLSEQQKLGVLRAYALCFVRLGKPTEKERTAVLEKLDRRFPGRKARVNRELCRVLSFLKSPTVVAKTLKLMAAPEEVTPPDWFHLAVRNRGYGKSVKKMLENLPSAQKVHYAYCLRTVPGPWTPGQRRQFFEWFSEAARKSGGNSYGGFLENMRKEALANCTENEREMIAAMKLVSPPNPFANLPPVKGPGKNWTKEEVIALMEEGLAGANLENGKRMFAATLCQSCHRFDGEGAAVGPDLSGVGSRFAPADLAEALVHPSSEVSDQYRFVVLTKADGSSLTGRIIEEKEGVLTVATSPFDFSVTTAVPRAEVATLEESPVSPMPPGLINRINKDELRDLLGYLMRNSSQSTGS